MKWLVIILIVLAVILAVALIGFAVKRKKDKVARERASELRSDAATTAAATQVEEARAREAQAEAERVRAEADKLEAHAQEQRTSYDMTRAQQEDSLREADRLDPDVDHRSSDYQPELDGTPSHRAGVEDAETPQETRERRAGGPANPMPSGPETVAPDEDDREADRQEGHPRRDEV
jgi:FtsZ-interacting cell division protein ZipA